MFYGNETDPDMLRIGTMNMTLHDVSDPQIFYKNSLTDDNKEHFDKVWERAIGKSLMDKDAIEHHLVINPKIENTPIAHKNSNPQLAKLVINALLLISDFLGK